MSPASQAASQSASRAGSASKPRKAKSIGVVLESLRAEFPDITVSKIRFLESEGLISPQRTKSGYRRFTEEDIARLRYILVTQRDHYLPLKVIREQLEAMDSGQVTALLGANTAQQLVSADSFRASGPRSFTDTDIAHQAGVELQFVTELVGAGLIRPDVAGFFAADDISVVTTAHSLQQLGFDIRLLKSLRNGARRQADLITQVAGPLAHGKSDNAQQQAEELSQQISALVVSLHTSLLKNTLRDEFDA